MKITPLLIGALLSAGPAVRAEGEKKPAEAPAAAEKEAPKPEGTDAAWAEVEPLLKGPKGSPQSRDEATKMYKEYLAELDEKSAAFLKAHPTDPRRWKLKTHGLQVNRMRSFAGLKAMSEAELAKSVDEILEAPDADKDSKGYASFIKVMESSEQPEKFTTLAGAHLKEYPDFKGNAQIETQIKTMEAEKTLKEKPIELSFTSTDGREVDLAKMRGKVVLVDFWATWCGPCIREIPNVVAAHEKLHDKGFEIVGIAFEREGDDDKLAEMTKEKKMTWPQYYDGKHWQNKFGQQFGITSIPRMWLVNKKGMLVDTNARENLAEKVEKLLAE